MFTWECRTLCHATRHGPQPSQLRVLVPCCLDLGHQGPCGLLRLQPGMRNSVIPLIRSVVLAPRSSRGTQSTGDRHNPSLRLSPHFLLVLPPRSLSPNFSPLFKMSLIYEKNQSYICKHIFPDSMLCRLKSSALKSSSLLSWFWKPKLVIMPTPILHWHEHDPGGEHLLNEASFAPPSSQLCGRLALSYLADYPSFGKTLQKRHH